MISPQGTETDKITDVYFGKYTDPNEDPIKGRKITLGNGLTAYSLYSPTATDFSFGIIFNFGSLNEGNLPVETAHGWEHAAFMDQDLFRLSRKYYARTPHENGGSIWTEPHRIVARMSCANQWSVLPALEFLCRYLSNLTDGKLDRFEQERIPMEIESRSHRNNADEFFPYSVVDPAIFHDTPISGRLSYARHYGHYQIGIGVADVITYHHANFSPDKMAVVIVSPNEEFDATKAFRMVDRTLGKLQMRPTKSRTLSIPTQAQTQKITVDKKYDAPLVGVGCRVPNTLDVIAGVSILDSMLADDGGKRYLEVARSQTDAEPKYSYHVYPELVATGTGTDAYRVHGPTLPGRHNALKDAIFEAWDIGSLERYKQLFKSGKERAIARLNERLQVGEELFLMVGNYHFDPRDVNDADTLRKKLEELTFDEVLNVQQTYITPGNCAAIAVARPLRKTGKLIPYPSGKAYGMAARKR